MTPPLKKRAVTTGQFSGRNLLPAYILHARKSSGSRTFKVNVAIRFGYPFPEQTLATSSILDLYHLGDPAWAAGRIIRFFSPRFRTRQARNFRFFFCFSIATCAFSMRSSSVRRKLSISRCSDNVPNFLKRGPTVAMRAANFCCVTPWYRSSLFRAP